MAVVDVETSDVPVQRGVRRHGRTSKTTDQPSATGQPPSPSLHPDYSARALRIMPEHEAAAPRLPHLWSVSRPSGHRDRRHPKGLGVLGITGREFITLQDGGTCQRDPAVCVRATLAFVVKNDSFWQTDTSNPSILPGSVRELGSPVSWHRAHTGTGIE